MPKSAKVKKKKVTSLSQVSTKVAVIKESLTKKPDTQEQIATPKKRPIKKKSVTIFHKKELEEILEHHTPFAPIDTTLLSQRNHTSNIKRQRRSDDNFLSRQNYTTSTPKHFDPFIPGESRVYRRIESLRTSHKHITFFAACLTLLIIIGSYVSPKGSAESVVFYPTSCLGGWIGPRLAEGPPNIEDNKDAEKFSEGNSAILPSGTNADIYCGGFVGDFKKNTKPTKILVTVSWAKGYDIETKKTITTDSFASSSRELLDSNASTTVIFTETDSKKDILYAPTTTTSESLTPDNATSTKKIDVGIPTSTSTDSPPLIPQVFQEQNVPPSKEQPVSTQTESIDQQSVVPDLQAPQSSSEPSGGPLSFFKQIVNLFAFGGAMRAYADEVVQSESLPISNTPILDQAVDTVAKTEAIISTGNESVDLLLQKADELLSKKVELPDISTTTLIVATQTIQASEFFDSSASTSFPTLPLFTEEASSSTFIFASTSLLISDNADATTTFALSASSTIVNVSTNAEDESPNNFLELMYTFDGVTWGSLGKVNEDSIVYRTFEIPVATTTSWDDISTLQIKVKYNGRIDPTPAIYLDGIKIEALYETPIEHEHPDFARDTILKDKSDDDIRVISIINADTNAKEIWYTTIREQGDFGVEPGSWVKVNLDEDKISYRLVEIYGRYLFWVDDIGKMLWTMNLEKSTNDGIVLNKNGTTTIPFIKSNGEQWYFDYNNQTREGVLRIER